MKCYRNITTDEVVYKEEAEEYVLNRLGITVTPKGENGEMTVEQLENIESNLSNTKNEELEVLKELYEKGVITEDEYNDKKERLLSK